MGSTPTLSANSLVNLLRFIDLQNFILSNPCYLNIGKTHPHRASGSSQAISMQITGPEQKRRSSLRPDHLHAVLNRANTPCGVRHPCTCRPLSTSTHRMSSRRPHFTRSGQTAASQTRRECALRIAQENRARADTCISHWGIARRRPARYIEDRADVRADQDFPSSWLREQYWLARL